MQYLHFLTAISDGGSLKNNNSTTLQEHCNVDKKTQTTNEPFVLSRAEAFKASKLNKNGASFFIAITVLSLFVIFCMIVPLYWRINDHYYVSSVLLIVIQMYLFTGIFITAHDAMHGLILPSYSSLNKYIGIICVKLYAFFDYDLLLKAHNDHHCHSGQLHHDPDYHEYEYDEKWKTIIVWFCCFMKEYGSIKSLILRGWIYNLLTLYFGYSHLEMNLFWSLPSILSAMQLWYFGTYLVHRKNHGNYNGNSIGNEHNGYA